MSGFEDAKDLAVSASMRAETAHVEAAIAQQVTSDLLRLLVENLDLRVERSVYAGFTNREWNIFDTNVELNMSESPGDLVPVVPVIGDLLAEFGIGQVARFLRLHSTSPVRSGVDAGTSTSPTLTVQEVGGSPAVQAEA